jgi:hypothetical protein
MLQRSSGIAGLLVCCACLCLCQETPRSTSADSFRIDNRRPYIYLQFEHEATGVERTENEPKMRFWFRLVNNCRVPIKISTFGVPKGSPANEVGVMYEVVLNTKTGGVSSEVPLPTSESATEPRDSAIPRGYMFEVGSSTDIPPGSSIQFSIPVNHLSRRWHIEIPYTFGLKDASIPRPSDIGGEPAMRLEYGIWYLPEDVQKALSNR